MDKTKRKKTIKSCSRCKHWEGDHWDDDGIKEVLCGLAIEINMDGNWVCNPQAEWCTYGAKNKPKIEPRTDDNTLMRFL